MLFEPILKSEISPIYSYFAEVTEEFWEYLPQGYWYEELYFHMTLQVRGQYHVTNVGQILKICIYFIISLCNSWILRLLYLGIVAWGLQ